jgi:hypothetical protein
MNTLFQVHGPFEVPTHRGRAARFINEEMGRQFWKENPNLAYRRGCYVFAIRAGRGATPLYVGMARDKFKQEVFAHHKLTRYQEGLADYSRGTPVLFFLMLPEQRGKPNTTAIRELERFLIQVAVSRNPSPERARYEGSVMGHRRNPADWPGQAIRECTCVKAVALHSRRRGLSQ